MAQQIINIGAAPNDGTGDPLRVAMQKANSNYTELYAIKADLAGAAFTGGISGTSAAFTGAISGTTGTFTGVVSGAAATNDGHLLNRITADARYGRLTGAAFTGTLTSATGIGTCGNSALTNTNVGSNTLAANTTGTNNTAVGVSALSANTTGANNVALGRVALRDNTTGSTNTAVGVNALLLNTTGGNNTATGSFALQANTASNNTAHGFQALRDNTTGGSNTASGVNALRDNTTGSNNTASGTNALAANTTGTLNTASGVNALSALTTETNCSGLGVNSAITGSNQVQLGDAATTTYVYGTVQNRSDARDKADIRDTKLGLDFINSLRPVDYRYDMRDSYKPAAPAKPDDDATPEQVEAYEAEMAEWLEAVKLKNITHDGSKKRSRYHSGIIAQELRDAIDAANFDAKGWGALQDHSIGGGDDVLSVGYDQFIAPLIKAIQEQHEIIETMKNRIAALEAK